MYEEEDCDDLPMITVNTSANDSSTFAMPSAEELATQRERELEFEHELEQIRSRARADQRHELQPAAPLTHSDSSGSEAELAHAAAALSVRAAPRRPAPPAAELWAALLPAPPPAALPALLPRLVDSVAAALPTDELHCACALLCVAALAHESRCRRRAARTLHTLLDEHAAPQRLAELRAALLAALPAPHVRLQLADVLRSGGAAGADALAAELCAAALLELLRPHEALRDASEAVSVERVSHAAAAWRACDSHARYTCVQLAGRLLAATSATSATSATQEARARLLTQLAPPPAAASDAQRPDRLKVLVGASKLKLLFHTEQ